MVKQNSRQRIAISIKGRVQGVGFRPFVYHLATSLNLTGWVQNTPLGVLIEIQGHLVKTFLKKLKESPPPLSKIDQIKIQALMMVASEETFQIIQSQTGKGRTLIAPDSHVCLACLQDLFDPQSRYYLYPFLNCTNCGPRFTLTQQVPYDRSQTAMDKFRLCDECEREYCDPSNRRYHAQPTACQACGPQLSVPIEDIAQAINAGKIVAIKGLGGYQLWCDATNAVALQRLRQRKCRIAKPFALMVANALTAASIVDVESVAQHCLESAVRPILLLKKRRSSLPEEIAPGLDTLGVMLPNTPLDYLIFHALSGYPNGMDWLTQLNNNIVVVTSANVSGNPLVSEDELAHQELSSIADLIVSHNRTIITRTDDSVLQIINNAPIMIRRARGYVPEPIKLPYAIPTTLGLGGHLKNTICLTRNEEAFVSQYIGSLNNKATIDFFHETLNHWLKFLNINIERVACDLHPNFYTTQYAEALGLPMYAIQHHHAHLAAVAAEHHVTEPALGLVLDGYGFGHNNEAWGGELMYVDQANCQRLAHFIPLTQPGNDIAVREPWRMASGVLHQLGRNNQIEQRFREQLQHRYVATLLQRQVPMQQTSSCGRLFDAASALLGVTTTSHYEGQAAAQLESLVTELEVFPEGWQIHPTELSFFPLLTALLDLDPIRGANIFHGTLIAGLTAWVKMWAQKQACQVILLSGGCFLNKILTEGLMQRLKQCDLNVFISQQVPPNDSGLSLGQAWIAGRQ